MNEVSSPALHDSVESHLPAAPYFLIPSGLLLYILETYASVKLVYNVHFSPLWFLYNDNS